MSSGIHKNISTAKPILYIVDDDTGVADFLAYAGREAGYFVQTMHAAQQLKSSWEEIVPDVVIIDIIMPDIDGIELLIWLARKQCTLPIILVSGRDVRHINSAASLAKAKMINVVAALQKPITLEVIETLLVKLKHVISEENKFIA